MDILYRDRVGSLADSMETIREIATRDNIINHLNRRFKIAGPVAEIKIEHYGYDARTDWNDHLVLARFENDDKFYPVGFTNAML